jgi:hypothetical protein
MLASEVRRLVDVALRALDAGEIDLAKKLLKALLSSLCPESTGLDSGSDR